MKKMLRIALATSLLFAAGSALAANDTPVGTWKTIDDNTGKPRSIVEITDSGGALQARVTKIMNLTPQEIALDGEHPHCKLCEGENKGKPIEGLVIMTGVRKDGDVWDGGHITDPKNGKVYKVKLTMVDGGQKMDVRGYIGFSLLGRTQTWVREQ